MEQDDFPDNGKAESRPTVFCGTGFIHPIERVKHLGQIFFGDTRTGIVECKMYPALLCKSFKYYPAFFRIVFDGIINEVNERSANLVLVTLGSRFFVAFRFPAGFWPAP